ncbi:MAG: haloacid dehalogenase-like hydrolase [Rickettsiales bacterium]|jgi:HAD superfamily phosphoserine phosphatase-like hydrolase|nr:haloacid dehalogenase-like hydrolase [Rickettsiales bacterium]
MLTKANVVVFDFDGTLSARDANMEFGKYCFRHSVRPWLFLPLVALAGMASLFNPGGIWWRQAMRRFLTPDMVKKLAPAFIKEHKMERFGWSKDQVAAERAAGNKVILISAGPDYLIPFLVSDIKFDSVICSIMDKEKPWKYKFFCWGRHKVNAMDEWAKRDKFIPRLVKSYSDSKSDLPLMELAGEQIWIDSKTGMRKD